MFELYPEYAALTYRNAKFIGCGGNIHYRDDGVYIHYLICLITPSMLLSEEPEKYSPCKNVFSKRNPKSGL